MKLVKVFTPSSAPELMAVVAMLEAHGIRCFVQHGGFGSLYPGVSVGVVDSRVVRVPEEDVPAALELIRDFEAAPPH